ncbi:hypothetical protein NQ318_006081 [Aromia moschata]|uniref:Uncharacterized protein n=1 Tax=Aromia moschata TaxID=1265417 RepID=A0AAV8Z290_9CUCU|nr:hypothetical protein NQ318_006081 [Aromia moschata]
MLSNLAMNGRDGNSVIFVLRVGTTNPPRYAHTQNYMVRQYVAQKLRTHMNVVYVTAASPKNRTCVCLVVLTVAAFPI